MIAGVTLLFCHLPKSAGTSVRQALQGVCPDLLEVYGGELRLGGPDPEFLRRWSAREQLPRVVIGHFSYGVHEFLDAPARYATFLRDPVERVCSLYRHQLADPDAPWHELVAAGMALGELVASGRTEQTNNHACRMLAGVVPQAGVRVSHTEILQRALGNLHDYFVCVGIVEEFERSMAALEETIGASLPRLRVNVSPRTVAHSEQDLEIVRHHNALDIELYERVRRRAGSPASGLDPEAPALE